MICHLYRRFSWWQQVRPDVDDDESFGQLVKRRRKGLGLTQVELARRTGYSVSTIRKVENDELRPSQPLAKTLAEYLNVASDQVLHFVRFARDRLGSDDWEGQDQNSVCAPSHATHYLGSLPAQPTPLIGRGVEVREAQSLLQLDHVRLLVLTGPPGVGKTHLSLRLASQMSDDFADGAVFVALAPIDEAERVASAIAQALQVTETSVRPAFDSIRDYLRDRRVLLVLDNFEQVVAAGPMVADLLAAAPRLKVLVTSREALRLRGEQDYPVLPLSLPARSFHDGTLEWEAIAAADAVRLFVARAQAVTPSFALTRENAVTVAAICHSLDGLPLAIELAAARMRVLSPQTLLAQLANRLSPLTGGARDLPPHQRSLRAAIAWSYDLLDENEKTLFRRLAVFAGGFTLEAAEAVCQDRDGGSTQVTPPDTPPVLDLLIQLVEKSLIVAEGSVGGIERYRLLETLRQFGRERLDASGEAETFRCRHARYYLEMVQQLDLVQRGPQQANNLVRLESELANLRAALRWYFDAGEAEHGLQLVLALASPWWFRGREGETAGWIRQLLALPGAVVPDALRVGALREVSSWASMSGDPALGQKLDAEALAIAREVGDRRLLAETLRATDRWWDHESQGRFVESLALYREIGDPVGISSSLECLGRIEYWQRDMAAARAYLEEGLTVARSLGRRGRLAVMLEVYGEVTSADDQDMARAYLVESLALYHAIGDLTGIASDENFLGRLDYLSGHYSSAEGYYRASLRLTKNWAWIERITQSLGGLAIVAAKQGQSRRAWRLASASARMRESALIQPCPHEADDLRCALEPMSQALSAADVSAADAEGRMMTFEQAVTYALTESTSEALDMELGIK
jgi:predicted ATPase/transcriptional regulator with XRE-family HTH domain